jgi:glycerate kinase
LYREAVRVLVAPDKFKGTLTAREAAGAIAAGWRRAVPETMLDVLPMADGGEGTMETLVAALGGYERPARVTGPLGDPVGAKFGLVERPGGLTAVVEMARASGLTLIAPQRRDPKRATSRGTGELILAACEAGARSVIVCIGGSATNDGGAGMAQAVGVRLLDAEGLDIRPGAIPLLDLARIHLRGLDPAVAAARFVVATDVDNPLLGPSGASAVYGPQKGASPEDVSLLDDALAHLAAVIHRDLGIDVRDVPGAGAAGGLGAGLVAFLGARLRPGVDVVMEAVGFRERLASSDLVVTGEGAFDSQSLRGKVPTGILRAARELGVPAVVLCGRREVDAPDAQMVVSLAERFGLEPAVERAQSLLEQLAFEVAGELESPGRAPGLATRS